MLRKLTRYLSSRGGNVAIILAFSLPVVIGFCGLGSEVGYWYYKNRSLQTAADAAAYGGAIVLKGAGTSSQITTAATTGASANGWGGTNATIAVHSPPVSGTHVNALSVEVDLAETLPRYFSGIYSRSPIHLSARSVVTIAGAGGCVLGLSPTASQDINISGSANLNAANCDVVSDSNASNAINMSGSARLSADCIVAVGSAATTSGLTLSTCTTPTNHATTVADPYLNVPAPPQSGTCLSVVNRATVIPQGWYCHGLSTSWGPITFSGLYVVSGGGLNLQAGTTATGTGVTFWIAAGQTMAVSGSAVVNFSAPTTGTYAGIVFFGDRTATNGNNAFSGSSTSTITGAVYFPSQEITYSGGTSRGTNCTELIGYTITISGSAYFGHNCTGSGMPAINDVDGAAGSVRIVE